jgi:hypothetical protein
MPVPRTLASGDSLRLRTPRTGQLPGRGICRWPGRSPIRPFLGPRHQALPAVLVVLAARGAQGTAELAAALAVNPSTATRMCDRLVRKG